jgi:pSer/pThr/pTyr-binding forkhead associated (FHA) protein
VVQLDILSGKKAGASFVARRFPFQIGRAAGAGLVLEDSGVFDRHATLTVHRRESIALTIEEGALASLNGDPIQTAALKNGDVIQLGAAKVRFTIAAARQRSQGWREVATWIGLGLICMAQVGIIYLLLE